MVTHTNRALGIDHWFSLGDSLVLTVMGQVAYMPVLVLAAVCVHLNSGSYIICPLDVPSRIWGLLSYNSNVPNALVQELPRLTLYGLLVVIC